MELSVQALNRWVDDFTSQLNAGTLAIFEGQPPAAALQEPLVSLPLAVPAFAAAEHGRAPALDLPTVVIARTGEAGWAQLSTAAGDVVATLTLRAEDAPDIDQADLVLDRVDFQRGGHFTITRWTLTLPRHA